MGRKHEKKTAVTAWKGLSHGDAESLEQRLCRTENRAILFARYIDNNRKAPVHLCMVASVLWEVFVVAERQGMNDHHLAQAIKVKRRTIKAFMGGKIPSGDRKVRQWLGDDFDRPKQLLRRMICGDAMPEARPKAACERMETFFFKRSGLAGDIPSFFSPERCRHESPWSPHELSNMIRWYGRQAKLLGTKLAQRTKLVFISGGSEFLQANNSESGRSLLEATIEAARAGVAIAFIFAEQPGTKAKGSAEMISGKIPPNLKDTGKIKPFGLIVDRPGFLVPSFQFVYAVSSLEGKDIRSLWTLGEPSKSKDDFTEAEPERALANRANSNELQGFETWFTEVLQKSSSTAPKELIEFLSMLTPRAIDELPKISDSEAAAS